MLREDGFVLDDGTTARLADDRFFMTTTTANAAQVLQHMEFCHQVLWPELDVQFVLGDRAVGAVLGRRPARRATLLRRLVDPPARHLATPRFPYHGGGRADRAAAASPARLFRISFSGELAYEIAVPARLWRRADPRA